MTTSARFVSLTIAQGNGGDVVMNINYELSTCDEAGEVLSTEQVQMALSDSEIRSLPQFPIVYPILRDICREAFVRENPEFKA
jgi:hypothetical protein